MPSSRKNHKKTQRKRKGGNKTVRFQDKIASVRRISPVKREPNPLNNYPKCLPLDNPDKVYPCRIQKSIVDNEQEHEELKDILQSATSSQEHRKQHYAQVFDTIRTSKLLQTPKKRRITPMIITPIA